MSDIVDSKHIHQLLSALGEQLAAIDQRYELVVIGGSALLALEVINRATQDCDLLALRINDQLVKADPLPAELAEARDRVSRDFGVSEIWLNADPTSLLDLGLPNGFTDRLEFKHYGKGLTVYFASRLDQIHLFRDR